MNTIANAEDRARIINNSGYKIVLAITGGGSDAIGNILRYGGGSKTLLEAIVPYSKESFDLFVGGQVDKYCSEDASRALAMASFQRAKSLTTDYYNILGVGATCSLAKDNERPGRRHTLYLTIISYSNMITYRKMIDDGSRLTQEAYVANYIINAIARHDRQILHQTSYDVDNDGAEIAYGVELSPGDSTLDCEQNTLIYGSEPVPVGPEPFDVEPLLHTLTRFSDQPTFRHYAVFPGSFNPMHDDHYNIIRRCIESRIPVLIEISTHNVDKLPLNKIEINHRKAAIIARCSNLDPKYFKGVVFTNAPRFTDKAKIFKNAIFLVGTDTINRLLDVKYYNNDDRVMYRSINDIKSLGCRFMIFPRSGIILSNSASTLINNADYGVFSMVHDFYSHGYSSSNIRKNKV